MDTPLAPPLQAMNIPVILLLVLAALTAATASLSEMLPVALPITIDITSSFDVPRSVITSPRSTTRIELSLIEGLLPDIFDIIPIMAKLNTIEITDDTIIANHAPTNEPSTTVKNFFILSLSFCLLRHNKHLIHKDKNFFAIAARLLRKNAPHSIIFCHAEHITIKILCLPAIDAGIITCQ